jgi:protein FAM50
LDARSKGFADHWPQNYEFHYFLLNKTVGYNGPLFSDSYSSDPTSATPQHLLPHAATDDPHGEDETPPAAPSSAPEVTSNLLTAAQIRQQKATALASALPDSELEGFNQDPVHTKVVDRRWYERNKHIYPASTWEEFDPERQEEYIKGVRKDKNGNAMFFSR